MKIYQPVSNVLYGIEFKKMPPIIRGTPKSSNQFFHPCPQKSKGFSEVYKLISGVNRYQSVTYFIWYEKI